MNDKLFDSEWRAACRIKPVPLSEQKSFILSHYLGKRPAIVTLSIGMFFKDEHVGMAIFSLPPKESAKMLGGKTWELSRLFIIDKLPKNSETWLIGSCIKFIKRNHPEIEYLISYADPSAGHSGTIYKASNWTYDGQTDAGRKTPRCDYADAITGKKYGRKGHVPAGAAVLRVPRVSKHRFIMPLKRTKK